MSVVESLLEILRAYFPDFELDGELGGRSRGRRPAPEPEPEWAADREIDPVLARCYADLGIPYGVDFRQVRRAWRRLMRRHHPDFFAADPEQQRRSTELVKKFNNAFEELGKRLVESRW